MAYSLLVVTAIGSSFISWVTIDRVSGFRLSVADLIDVPGVVFISGISLRVTQIPQLELLPQ